MASFNWWDSPTAEQEDEKQRRDAFNYAQLTNPTQQNLYEIARGGQAMQEGIRGLVGTGLSMATGQNVDVRSPGQQRNAAIENAKQQVKGLGFNPDDPKSIDAFYKKVIQVLQSNGLIPEAMEVAKEYQAAKVAQTRAQTGVDTLEERVRSNKAKEQLARDKMAQAGPEIVQLGNALDNIANALANADPDDPRVAQLTIKYERFLNRMQELAGMNPEIRTQDLGNEVVVYDRKTGEEVKRWTKGQKPGTAGSGESNPKSINDSTLMKLGSGMSNVQQLAQLANSFRSDFSGSLLFKGLTMFGAEDAASLLRRIASTNPAAASWWQRYSSLVTQIRHELFGATLTEGEAKAFAQIKASIGDEPSMVLQMLRNQAMSDLQHAETQITTLGSGGRDVSQLQAQVAQVRNAVSSMSMSPGGAPSSRSNPGRRPSDKAPSGGKPRSLDDIFGK